MKFKDRDFDNMELEELKQRQKAMKQMLELFGELTDDNVARIKVETINLTDMLDNMAFMLADKDDTANELINVIKQFQSIIKDFCKKNKIKLKEE